MDVNWHTVTVLGGLLVGTDEGITMYKPDSGEVLWTRDDLKKLPEANVEEIGGTPYLLVDANVGSVQAKTSLRALDVLTGKDLWTTEEVRGVTVGSFPMLEKNLVLLVTVPAPAAKSKLDFQALDLATGKTLWASGMEDKVDLHVSEASGRFLVKYDLSGHQPPVFDNDSLFVSYAGLHRFDLATGKLAWSNVYDVTAGSIKKGNAQIVLDGEVIYTSAKGQLRAIDRGTGQIKWTSKDFGGALAQMELSGDVLYGRLGGNFYDKLKKEWDLKKPLGVVAVDKKTGTPIWRYDGAKEGITNMVLLQDQGTILIADTKNLIGLDMKSQGEVKEAFKVKVEFKDKIGAAKIAAGVGKFLLGGAKAALAKSGDQDAPVGIAVRKNGTAIVLGKQHLLAFDPKTKAIAWSVQYEAPGAGAWAKTLMGAMTAISYMGYLGQAASTGSSAAASGAQEAVIRYGEYAGKRYSAAGSSLSHAYILTNVKEGEEKGAGLVGVNLDSGKGDRQILFKDKEPRYEVDEIAGRVFVVRDDKELLAFSVQ
jgi:outer membrane protein assembly factor BamB